MARGAAGRALLDLASAYRSLARTAPILCTTNRKGETPKHRTASPTLAVSRAKPQVRPAPRAPTQHPPVGRKQPRPESGPSRPAQRWHQQVRPQPSFCVLGDDRPRAGVHVEIWRCGKTRLELAGLTRTVRRGWPRRHCADAGSGERCPLSSAETGRRQTGHGQPQEQSRRPHSRVPGGRERRTGAIPAQCGENQRLPGTSSLVHPNTASETQPGPAAGRRHHQHQEKALELAVPALRQDRTRHTRGRQAAPSHQAGLS